MLRHLFDEDKASKLLSDEVSSVKFVNIRKSLNNIICDKMKNIT